MKKVLISIIITVIFLTGISFGAVQDSSVQMDELIQEALNNNPDLQASYNSWQAVKAKVPQAGSLPDPILGFSLMNLPVNSFDFNQESMTGKQVSLTQLFPLPGKLGLKERIAKKTAYIVEMQHHELRNQLVKNIKSIYYELYYNERAIETSEKNKALLNQFTQIAETRYRAGMGLQQDVLKSQVELAKIDDKIIRLNQNRETLLAQLKILLNRNSEKLIQGNFVIEEMDTLRNFELSKIKLLADQNRPLLQAWKGMVQKSQQEVSLAKKSYLPDFSLGVAYTQRDVLTSGIGGIDFFSGSISINLPLYFWKKQSKNVEESKYNEISATHKYEFIQRQIEGELESKLSVLNRNRRLIDLYKSGIIPQASQTVKSALAAYQVNKVDFLTLVNNQKSLFNYELDYYRILSDYYKNIAELEALVGTKF